MSSRCSPPPPVQRQARHHCSMRSSGDPKFFSLTRRGKEELERASHFFLGLWPGSSHYFYSYPINQNLFTCPHLYPRKAGQNVSMCTSKTSSKRKERKHSRRIINSLWNQWMACPPLQGHRSFFQNKTGTHTQIWVCVLLEQMIHKSSPQHSTL